MQLSSLAKDGAQWRNGNLPNSYRFSLETDHGPEHSAMWEGAQRLLGGLPHQVMSLPSWQGMLQKMGDPGVPAAGELKGACRTFLGQRPRPE